MEEAKSNHILLVEDTLTQAIYMQHALEGAGYKVSLARSGEKALAALEEQETNGAALPDMVLSDINMPGIDGMEMIAAIKQREKTKNLHCVLLVTPSAISELKDLLACPADGIVFKSGSEAKFVNQVKLVDKNLAAIGRDAVKLEKTEILLSSDDPLTSKHKLMLYLAQSYQQILDSE